ncbi:MAG: ATP-binding protein [Candidatus Bipolaricaulota bacterium]|nr:ATP-binding protein [Candidatus Bipolaricaulota bacterium]
MSKRRDVQYERSQAAVLGDRLSEPRRFLQVVAGPRQAGKTTLVRQALAAWGERARYASADEPTLRDRAWIAGQWVLALDEIQKVPGWSETVKRLWDEDTAAKTPLRVVVLGSAPLLIQRGLSESLAGRFEILHVPHWTFVEMQAAFWFTLDQYILYGGYPGSAPLIGEPERWARYIKDSLIETTVSRDVLLLTRVDKPALLRQLFELGCRYSGQILSYTKMLRQLQDAGNTTTLAHYLELLAGAGMLAGLPKYSGSAVRQRGSSPKLQVLNNALMSVQSGLTLEEAHEDPAYWGRLTESAVGAHLANAAAPGECRLSYWRDKNREVDFVVEARRKLFAVEVKSGRRRDVLPGLAAFTQAEKRARPILIGGDGIPVEEALSRPVGEWT